MADDATLKIGLEADTSNASRDMKAAATTAAELGDAFRQMGEAAATGARLADKLEKTVSGITSAQRNSAQSTQANTQAILGQAKAANQLATSLKEVANTTPRAGAIHTPGTGGSRSSSGQVNLRPDLGVGVTKQERDSINATNHAREQSIKIRQREQDAIRQTVLANIAENRAWRETNSVKQQFGNTAADVAARMQNYVYAAHGVSNANDHMRDSLFTARFALNDISVASGIAGAALLAFNAVTVKAAADYESAMAAIDRTTGATSSQVAQIRDDFIGLAQSIPGGFENIAKIGELAGQLNIGADRIASFTETVAQFASSTDVSVQTSAEAFGRLDTLLPDVQGNYEALGSSILNVGVNSVATESAIISTTSQIAAAGAQARFTADEVIGLAASYASLGIAPEAARGSTIRIFSEIRTAAVEGGDALEAFAEIAGMSAAEFKSEWLQGDASEVFLNFLKGLQKEGAAAESTLRSFGITGVRDINALLRLSQNIDIVSQSFGYANSGFTEATQLGEAFGITSQTLNSRLEILGQSFQALFATLGQAGTGPIKSFVDALIEIIKFMTEIAKNPAAQWVTVFGGLFTLLAGGVLILTSIVARIGALRVAMVTTRFELERMSTSLTGANAQLATTQVRALNAGIALTRLSTILKGIGYATAITAGITLLIAGFDAIGEATKSAGQKAKDAFGDLSGLTSALSQDTKEVAAGTQTALGTIEGKMTTTTNATADWVKQLEGAIGAQTTLAAETDRVKQSIDAYTYSIGENTAAWLANQLANDDAVKKLFQANAQLQDRGAPQLDTQGVFSAAVRGDVDEANRIIDEYQARLRELAQSGALTPQQLLPATDVIDKAREAVNLTTGALGDAALQGQITAQTFEAMGVSADFAAGELAGIDDGAAVAADAMALLRDSVVGAFSELNVIAAFADSARALFQGLVDGAATFNVVSEAGSDNMANLQDAIIKTITAGQVLGANAVESVGALFLALQREGVNTANLLASLASIPGIGTKGVADIKGYLDGTKQLSGAGLQLTNVFDGVSKTIDRSAKSIGGGGGSRGLGGAAKEAAKEVRTLVDYAGDLQGVFSRAFEIRFSAQQGIDAITSQWQEMRDAIKEANDNIAEAKRNIAELTADNNILKYFKQVADQYGDTLRSDDIAAEIAKNNAEIAEETSKASDATKVFDKTLKGNSSTAIDNRAQILGLVQQYEDLITAYAKSGMDQTTLAIKTQELKKQFIDQATQLGYNVTELGDYSAAFDDVAIAIAKIPRNVTVTMNTNPAMQALAEWEAQAKRSVSNVRQTLGGGGGIKVPGLEFARADLSPIRFALQKQIDALTGELMAEYARLGGNSNLNTTRMESQLRILRQTLANVGFESGGYTGNGGTKSTAGVVHGQEFVINAKNTKRLGLPFLNALNSGSTPTAGSNIMVVELSARDRALLAAAGNVTLSIDGKAIANATNGANFVAASRGSN